LSFAQGATSQPSGSIAIVVDTSEMPKERFATLNEAVDSFLAGFSGESDELSLFITGGTPQMVENFTADPAKLSGTLDHMRPGGKPKTYEAVEIALKRMRAEAGNLRRAVVLFAASSGTTSEQGLKNLGGDIPVNIIALPGEDWRSQETMQRLSADTKGVAYFTANVDQLREVASVLGRRLSSGASNVAPDTKLSGGKPLAGYRRAILSGIVVNPGKDDPQGDETALQQALLAQLRREKVFDEVVDATSQTADLKKVKGDSETVIVMSRLLDYQRGSRLQRQFIGWKGEARYKVQLSVFDASTHQPVFAVAEKGSSASGFLGGSQEVVHAKAVKRVVARLVEDLKRAK
jgi:hypothetical protein